MTVGRISAIAGVLLGLGGALSVTPLLAEDFPEASAAAQTSITQGFRQSSLPLLRRVAGDGPEASGAALLGALCPSPCSSATTGNLGSVREVSDSSWSLRIVGDGTGAEFRNFEVGKRAHALAKDEGQKASAESLVRLARAYISEKLASVIVMGPEEKLVPLRADYRIEAGQDLKTLQSARSVVASRVVFGRTIQDVPIVGGGSTLVLTFANDGALESFQYDWPKYEIAGRAPVVGIEDIVGRVQRVTALRMGIPMTASSGAISKGHWPNYELELMQNAVLQKLDCGFYDPGFIAREATAPVQPGCVYRIMARSEEGSRTGLSGAVPGAALIEPDPGWTEAVALRGPRIREKPAPPGPAQ
jgi:hypothetical protein